MPIRGLTDNQQGILEAGRLRLGPPKSDKSHGLMELGYFRRDFRPGQEAAALEFLRRFGEKPTQFECRLPFKNMIKNWDAYYRVYNTAGLLGLSDGFKWLYLRDNKTDEVIVNHGIPMRPGNYPQDESGNPFMPFDKKIPVYSYTAGPNSKKAGQQIPVYATTVGMLNVHVPGVGGIVIPVRGVHSISRLSKQLAYIEEKAEETRVPITTIPIVIYLRLESVPVTINSKRSTEEHYILNAGIRKDWLDAYDTFMDALLPGATITLKELPPYQQKILSLPDGVSPEELDESDETGQAESATESAPAPAPAPVLTPAEEYSQLCACLFASQATDKSAKLLALMLGDVPHALAWAKERAETIKTTKGLTAHITANWPGFEAVLPHVFAECGHLPGDITDPAEQPISPCGVIAGIDRLAAIERESIQTFQNFTDSDQVAVIQSFLA